MLPSKGFFSCIPCPYYDSGNCIRPHCHFRHSKKDRPQESNSNPSTSDHVSTDKNRDVTRINIVTEAMKQVLDNTDLIQKSEENLSDSIVNNVCSIEPSHESSSKEFSNFPSYKPTPISELNKRHIPVVYAPTKPICFVHRPKKKDLKESLPYLPKSLNKYELTSHGSSLYKSTTNNKDDVYEPEEPTSIYTYQPTQISEKKPLRNNGQLTTSECKDNLNENEEKLKELDKLIDEEFGPSNHNIEHKTVRALSENEHLSENSSNKGNKNGGSSKKFDTPDNVIKVSNQNNSDSLNTDINRKKLENCNGNNTKHINIKHLDRLDIDNKKELIQPTASKENETITPDSKEKKHVSKSSKEHKSSSSKENKHSRSSSKSKCKKSSSKEKHMSESYTSNNEKKDSASKVKGHSHISSNSCKISKSIKHSSNKTNSVKDSDCKKKKRTDKSDSSYKEKRERDSCKRTLPNKTSEKNQKLTKHSHRTEESKANISTNTSIIDVDAQDDVLSCSSDVEEVPSKEDLIIIDSSSNSSFAVNELPESERNSEDSSSYLPEIPPPAKKRREHSPAFLAPQKVFSERWQKAWETIALKSSVPGKMKISHVPNVSSLINAKNEIIAEAKRTVKPLPACSSTVEYVPKPVKRKAHVPHERISNYPVIIIEDSSKVPSSIRQTCLNNIYDEYVKFCNPEEARKKAQEHELEISRRLNVTKTYQNAVALALLRIRKNKGQLFEQKVDKKETGRKLSPLSIPEYTYGVTLYDCFLKYVLSEDEYIKNGYPIPMKAYKNCAYIDVAARRSSIKQPDDKSFRICINCSKYYSVDENGFPQDENECFYHFGRLYKTRGHYTEKFSCCGAESGSEPCTIGRYHVANLFNEDRLEGFVSSQSTNSNESVGCPGIYALDCEMCYTTRGLELTRCTVVDLNGDRVYDQVVLPDDPILDYCTRFSGITADMLKDCNLKLKDVQRDLLKFISEKTILVGHSLENDMKALRLLHKYVVDTSVIFPHRQGLPLKRSLKNLVKDILQEDIQNNENGHDSFEDAYSCMRILLWKITEDAKGRKPRVIISLDSKAPTQIARRQCEIYNS